MKLLTVIIIILWILFITYFVVIIEPKYGKSFDRWVENMIANADIVVETIALESSGDSFEAQVMVAQTILTRAKEWNMTLEEVCLQPYQFSCWNEGIRQKMKKRTARELTIARKAFKQAQISTNSLPAVTHYHNSDITPYWASSMEFVCQIGKLIFYYEKRRI